VGELHVHFELPNVRAMNDLDHAAVSRIAEMLVDEIRIQKVKDDLVKHRNVS